MRLGVPAMLAAAGLLLLLPPAAAQVQETPVMGAPAGTEKAEQQAGRVLVLGDALGGGLGAGLSRVAEAAGNYDVSVRFNEESGLARPEVYDWPATVSKILRSNSFGAIVVMLGANDTQPIRRQDGERIPVGTPEWAEAYGERVDRMLSELATSGARIIWVGPPPMRDPQYDAAIKEIAAIQRQRAEAKGAAFIDMRPVLAAPDGSYAESGPDDTGTLTRLRGRDGISFYKAGNNRMGQIVLSVLEGGEAGTLQAGAGEAAGAAEDQASQVPIFGQLLMNGEAYAVQPEGVTANAVMLAAAGLEGEAALKALRDLSPQGSNAINLFRYGHAPAAPAGRADDFAAPAAP